ncbi:MAG: hypothetical protein IPM92_11080 [Saprospiraceae bacterium]|nr:hypothetical protein [Saprospiraceae bacterium]
MKYLSIILILVFVGSLIGQNQEFKLDFKLRFENQKIYCDVIPTENYEVATLQFGIHHNSEFVEFDTLTSDIILDVGRKIFNEICPRNVRIVWINKSLENVKLQKNVPFLTLEYRELFPTDHFICLMPSAHPSCTTMVREVLYDINNTIKYYSIPDACIEYRIKDGIIIVASEEQKNEINFNLVYNGSEQALRILGSVNEMLPIKLMVFDLLGHTIFDRMISNVNDPISIPQIKSGLYTYILQNNTMQQHSGVIPIFCNK